MKLDRFLLITVGALLVIIVILMAMGGAAFLCLFATHGPVTNEGPLLEKSYDFNGTLGGFTKADLQIMNINGAVNIKEGKGDAFVINVNTIGTERDYERYKVEFTQSESAGVKTLKLEIKDTKEPRMYNTRYVADITVTVPKSRQYDLNLVTVNGRADLGNLTCDEVKMATVNGGITISIPIGSALSLNAHVVNGHIANAVPITVNEKSMLGLVGKTANYTEGLYIEAATVNGGIDITTH